MQGSLHKVKVHARKGDTIQVVAGRDKGKNGKVLKVLGGPGKLIIEGINMRIKHVRPNQQAGIQGGRVEQERPIHHSNVMLVCPKCSKRTRNKVVRGEGKERRRECLQCGAEF